MKTKSKSRNPPCAHCPQFSGYCKELGVLLENGYAMQYHSGQCETNKKKKEVTQRK